MKEGKICYLCGHDVFNKREGKVRDNPNLEVFQCVKCGLIFLSSFEHIDDSFYENSLMHGGAINVKDWEIETSWDDERRFNYLRKALENKDVLDFGCGNGGFMMRARNCAALVEGVEVERRLEAHFRKKKLKVYKNLDEINNKYDIITAFHVIEHIKDPVNLLRKLATLLKENGLIIVEVPNGDDALITLYRCKAFAEFTYWSCHLFLFNDLTIKMLVEKAGLNLMYVKQIQRYPLANHLYWLSFGMPGGHKKWGFIDSGPLNKEYENALAKLGLCDTLIAGISK